MGESANSLGLFLLERDDQGCNRDPAQNPRRRPNSCYENTVSGQFENTNGNTLPASPKNKIAANANYTWHFTPGSLNYSVSYIWKDKTPSSIFSEQYFVAPSYSQVDMRLSWNDAADRFTIFGYVKNLQNKLGLRRCRCLCSVDARRRARKLAASTARRRTIAIKQLGLTPPRTYGVEVQYRLK